MHRCRALVQVALLSLALPLHAQSASAGGQAATFQAQARAVDVDVVVLDSHGKPVRGLSKADFLVLEDGVPQTIDFFEPHPSASGQPDAPANVLLIDTLNTTKEDLGFARRSVDNYLKKMPSATSLAVFSLGQTLRMVQGFTTDRAMLLAAVSDNKTGAWSETSPASNMPAEDADDRERASQLQAMNMPASTVDMLHNAQEMHKAYQSDRRIAMTLADLQRLARYLAKMPGRKNLIWFSGSFPIALFPEPGVRGSLATTAQDQQIKDTTDLLAAARVAIYPVSAQGVAVETTGDASDHDGMAQQQQPVAPAGIAPPSGTSIQSTGGTTYQTGAFSNPTRQEDSARAANFAAMHALAAATGGEMLPDSNNLARVVEHAIRNGSQYYTLSYTPANTKRDGSFRRIEVKLRSGGDTLAYRRGYYATGAALGPTVNTPKLASSAVSDPLSPLMRSGIADSTEVQYEVRVQPVTPQPAATEAPVGGNAKVAGPVTRYRTDFTIRRTPGDLPHDSAHPDRMQLEVIAYDKGGRPLNWQAGALNLTAEDDRMATQRGIHTHMEIDVPKDAASLATGVYDWTNGKAGTRQIALSSVPVPEQKTAAAPPPTSVVPAAGTPAAARAPELVQRTPEMVKQIVQAKRQIHLDVVVTDAAGHAVSGLQQSDFTVLDNNVPQPLQSFRAADGLTAQPPVEIVLVLDTMNTSFQEFATVRQGVEKFLRKDDGRLALPVSAVFLTDTGVKGDHATRDGNALAEDIARLPTPVHVINSAQGLDGLMARFTRSVNSLTQILQYEKTKPGRKLMLWLGSGWPMLTSQMFHVDEKNRNSFFQSIVDLSTGLREARVTLYSLMPLDLNKDTERRALLYRNYRKGIENAKQADAGNLSLQVLAEQSGGLAVPPTGDIEGGMEQCLADAHAFYELTFDAAAAPHVDTYHSLDVTLSRPGLTARTTTAYYAQP